MYMNILELQMAESPDEQAALQHYLVCGSEDCQKNGQFYCNNCHRLFCQQCKDEHLKSPETQIHEIVLYRYCKHQLPIEKCKLHPKRNIDIFCKECHIPLCSKCSTKKEHKRHTFDDLEDIYAEKYTLQQSELAKIPRYFLPTTQGLKTDIKEDITDIRNVMESIRTSMKVEAESLKNLVDEVKSENLEHAFTVGGSLLKMLQSQRTTYDAYIAYLECMTDKFQKHLSFTNQKLLFSKTLRIKTIPEITKPVPPVFTRGQFNKKDVAKLLGRVHVPNTKQVRREIKPMEALSTHVNFSAKQVEQCKEKSIKLQTLAMSSFVSKIMEYSLPDVNSAYHITVDKAGRLWVSDEGGNLVQTDLQGNLLQKIQTSGGYEGYHTATLDGDLIYTDRDKRVIFRIKPDRIITEFIKTGDWTPISIYSSCINGDILVGMITGKKAKVTRYSKTGKELHSIQRDNKGQDMYSAPDYITENKNGDICTSDSNKLAVVVVNKLGQRRFSYTGQGSKLSPWGICTDIRCHILVCEEVSESVHMLNQDGKFLSIILSPNQGIKFSRSVCLDVKNYLYVGQSKTSTVTVYNYLNGSAYGTSKLEV